MISFVIGCSRAPSHGRFTFSPVIAATMSGLMRFEGIAKPMPCEPPERFFAPDMGGLNNAGYQRVLQKHGARITLMTRLKRIERAGNKLRATLGTDFASRTQTREVDQVVVEHGTLPADDLYFALKPRSRNLGEVDYRALVAGKPQRIARNKKGTFQLFRIGDAVQHRNIHAAIYDALRLVKDL